MSIQIRDESTVKQLLTATQPVELRSEDGMVLGRFVPADLEDIFPEFGMTYEEMLRDIRDPNTKWYTPEEVMARLREIDQCLS